MFVGGVVRKVPENPAFTLSYPLQWKGIWVFCIAVQTFGWVDTLCERMSENPADDSTQKVRLSLFR